MFLYPDRASMLDTRCSMPDTGYSILDAGYSILDALYPARNPHPHLANRTCGASDLDSPELVEGRIYNADFKYLTFAPTIRIPQSAIETFPLPTSAFPLPTSS